VTVLNTGCLLLVAVALAIAVGVVRSRRVIAKERREDRARRAAGDQLARDFAASVKAGYVTYPTWDPKPAPLRLPEETP
jgi:hypothetical protein